MPGVSALPPLNVITAQAVIGLPRALPGTPGVDEHLVAALRPSFANVVHREAPILGAPPQGARLVLTSTSSQLVISDAQADFQVRFYGDFPADPERCLAYAHTKVEAIRLAFAALDLRPITFGVVLQSQFSFRDLTVKPTEHILATHLRLEVDPHVVKDTVARVAVEVRDRYYVLFRVADYETRTFQRAIMPGDVSTTVIVRPWEGTVEDYGVSLTVDVNNTPEAQAGGNTAEITEHGVSAVFDLARYSMVAAGPEFVRSGKISADLLVGEPA
jgi:hypothetical protein